MSTTETAGATCPVHKRKLECPSCRAAYAGAFGGRVKSEKKAAAVRKNGTMATPEGRKAGQQARRQREREKAQQKRARSEKRAARAKVNQEQDRRDREAERTHDARRAAERPPTAAERQAERKAADAFNLGLGSALSRS